MKIILLLDLIKYILFIFQRGGSPSSLFKIGCSIGFPNTITIATIATLHKAIIIFLYVS